MYSYERVNVFTHQFDNRNRKYSTSIHRVCIEVLVFEMEEWWRKGVHTLYMRVIL